MTGPLLLQDGGTGELLLEGSQKAHGQCSILLQGVFDLWQYHDVFVRQGSLQEFSALQGLPQKAKV